MKLKNNKLLLIIALFTLFMLFSTTNVHAVLQSNGDEAATKNFESWMLQIRQMQSSGGTLGLTDTIAESGLTSSNTNLDIHTEKNTEYGAMILLSASSYGNPNPITDGDTTTGNASGVVMKINSESVAAACSNLDPSTWKNASPRYKNIYALSYERKMGDSVDVGSWHGGKSLSWLYVDYYGGQDGHATMKWAILVRANDGSAFSYNGNGGNARAGSGSGSWYGGLFHSRAAIVVGAGI